MSFHVFRCKKAKSTCFNANFHYISLKCMCCRYLLATKIHPNCIRNAQNRKSQIVKSYLSYIEPSPQFLPEHKSFLFRIWLFLLTSPVTTTTIVALLRSPLAFYTWEAGFVQLLMVVDVQVKKSSILRLSLSPFSCSNS